MILQGRQISFAYRREAVLCGIDISIGPGLTAVIGPNAAGKSTLLRCLCGLLKPAGEVTLNGCKLKHFARDELAHLVSYLPQELSTTAVLTVFEAVLLGRLHRLGWRVGPSDEQVVEELLAEVGLSDLAGRYVNELSGGQLQMAAIAQSLARQPAVLLMDEPTSNLDLRHQLEVCTLIRDLASRRQMSVAMAMHDLNLAARFADHVYLLDHGRIAGVGSPNDVLTAATIADCYQVAARVESDVDGRPAITTLGLLPRSR